MEKKCTCCGSSNLKEFNVGLVEIKKYVCLDCLHIEFYANPECDAYKEVVAEVNKEIDTKNKLAKLNSDKKKAKNAIESLKLNVEAGERRIIELKKQAENEDITVKEQKAILAKLSNAEEYLNDAKANLLQSQKQLSKIEFEIKKLK